MKKKEKSNHPTIHSSESERHTLMDFFKLARYKLHIAARLHAAAELIVKRINSDKERMGLTTWETAPHGKIIRVDV